MSPKGGGGDAEEEGVGGGSGIAEPAIGGRSPS